MKNPELVVAQTPDGAAQLRRWGRIVTAARGLVAALDDTVPEWRADTLGHAATGDEVNAAWDALISALEDKG